MAKSDKIAGKTTSGFEFSYSRAVFDDMEFFELEQEWLETNKVKTFSKMLVSVLGEAEKARLYDHVRNISDTGRVSIKQLVKEYVEMITAEKTGKNS